MWFKGCGVGVAFKVGLPWLFLVSVHILMKYSDIIIIGKLHYSHFQLVLKLMTVLL